VQPTQVQRGRPVPDRVFVRLWIAEIDQNAIAHELGDETIETAHGLFNASLVEGYYVA
jgi:hypothetical protein